MSSHFSLFPKLLGPTWWSPWGRLISPRCVNWNLNWHRFKGLKVLLHTVASVLTTTVYWWGRIVTIPLLALSTAVFIPIKRGSSTTSRVHACIETTRTKYRGQLRTDLYKTSTRCDFFIADGCFFFWNALQNKTRLVYKVVVEQSASRDRRSKY